MALLRDFTGQTLQWKRPRFFSSTYELRAKDQMLATISRAGTKRAIAEAEGQQWVFQREGLRRVLVYPGGHQASNEPVQPLALIQPGWRWNGDLTFRNSHISTWTRTGKWRSIWSWRDPGDQILLTFKKGRLLEIAPAASDLPDLALLALFGFYLILLMEEEDATTAATLVVSSN